jgi:SAM-dependent methyltransferase
MREQRITMGSETPRVENIRACPLCGKNESDIMFQVGDRLHHIPGSYRYKRCSTCSTVYQDPQVIAADLPLCYPEKYYTHQDQDDQVEHPPRVAFAVEQATQNQPARTLRGLRDKVRQSIMGDVRNQPAPGLWGAVGKALSVSKTLRERAFFGILDDDLLPKTCRPQRALEIGCGSGRSLARLNTLWDAEGVEWDPMAAETARKRTGCLIHVGDFQSLDLPLEAYSLIFMHHVFEHLADPNAALRRILELLSPSGRAVLVYPNPQALGARIYGDDWFPWEVPRHLVFPPLRALRNLAEEIGFKALRWETKNDNAAEYFSRSRLYRQGLPVEETRAYAQSRDHVLSFVERLLILAGMDAGEEIVIVLEK